MRSAYAAYAASSPRTSPAASRLTISTSCTAPKLAAAAPCVPSFTPLRRAGEAHGADGPPEARGRGVAAAVHHDRDDDALVRVHAQVRPIARERAVLSDDPGAVLRAGAPAVGVVRLAVRRGEHRRQVG